jgi:hypothetical protein
MSELSGGWQMRVRLRMEGLMVECEGIDKASGNEEVGGCIYGYGN